jgi:hypothetical protein
MPPSVTPTGLPVSTTGTLTITSWSMRLEEVGVQHVAVDGIALVVLEEHRALLAAVDLEGEDGVELCGVAIATLIASGSTATWSGAPNGP